MNESPLALLFGSRAAEAALLHLYHYGETYGRAVSSDMDISLVSVQRQLDKFERAGTLVSKSSGRTRLYTWNRKSPLSSRLEALVEVIYESMPLRQREELFSIRRRPRRAGKP